MINNDKTDIEKEELELWKEVTKKDKKYNKNSYLHLDKVIKKPKFNKKKANLNIFKEKKDEKIIAKVIKKDKKIKLENLSPDKIPSGISLRQAEKLKRGQLKPELIIDLHGFTTIHARDHITKNILHSYNNGIRCILIITGKKLGLQGSEGVLKREVPKWLNMPPLREVVLMNSWATSQHGGQGALYVLLKKFK